MKFSSILFVFASLVASSMSTKSVEDIEIPRNDRSRSAKDLKEVQTIIESNNDEVESSKAAALRGGDNAQGRRRLWTFYGGGETHPSQCGPYSGSCGVLCYLCTTSQGDPKNCKQNDC